MTSAFPYLEMERAIVAHIDAGLGTGMNIPIFYPNAPETAPDLAESRPPAYVSVHILHGESAQVDFGAAQVRIRRSGILQFSIYAQVGKGTKRTTEIADTIIGFIRRTTLTEPSGTVKFEEISPRPGLREGAYWRVDLSARFYSDDFDS